MSEALVAIEGHVMPRIWGDAQDLGCYLGPYCLLMAIQSLGPRHFEKSKLPTRTMEISGPGCWQGTYLGP